MARDTVKGLTLPTNANFNTLSGSTGIADLVTAARVVRGVINSSGVLGIGSSGTPQAHTAGTPLMSVYSTNAGTSGSTNAEPFLFQSTMTGAGQVGGRMRVNLITNVKLGGWANALKVHTDCQTNGGTSGLISTSCHEMTLPGAAAVGTFGVVEVELIAPTSFVAGAGVGSNCQSFFYSNLTGAAKAQIDTSGFYFSIAGFTAGATKCLSLTSQTLKCAIGATTRYLMFSQHEDGLGLGVSGTAMVLGTSLTKRAVDIYTTSASVNTGTSVRPFYMESTMTGAGGVGGRAEFFMTTNVALGGWSNALKGLVTYGASGRTNGLGSAVCAEIVMSAGCTQGNYAPLETELVADSACATGTATGFIYGNIAGSDATGKTSLNTNGYFCILGAGVVDTAGGLFDANAKTGIAMTHVLKWLIGGTVYYSALNTSIDFGGS